MKKTKVTAHLNEQISSDNLIYCSTFQLVWNELSTFLKGRVSFTEQCSIVDELNKMSFTKEHLDESCYLTYADFISSGILDKIKTNLQQKFREISKLDLDPKSFSPDDILAYSFLLKILTFEKKFEELKDFSFCDDGQGYTPVEAFGLKTVKRDTEKKLRNQARVLYYSDDNDFTVSLRTLSQDYMVLAKTAPQSTLQETLSKVRSNLWNDPDYLKNGETLQVPKLDFDLEHHYKELTGKIVCVDSKPTSYFVADAVQFIKFILNEEGAKLRSEAAMTLRKCAALRPPTIRHFVFNKPFLLYLAQGKDAPPYFVAWISNSEVMKRNKA